MSPLLAGCCW